MFLYNVYRVGCEVSPLLLTHGSLCSANSFIFKTDAYFPFFLVPFYLLFSEFRTYFQLFSRLFSIKATSGKPLLIGLSAC